MTAMFRASFLSQENRIALLLERISSKNLIEVFVRKTAQRNGESFSVTVGTLMCIVYINRQNLNLKSLKMLYDL